MVTVVCGVVAVFMQFSSYLAALGSSVAKYAGEHVHKRLVEEAAYKERQYPEALKRAFLNTDDDMKKSTYDVSRLRLLLTAPRPRSLFHA